MRAYNNTKNYLDSIKYTLVSSPEDIKNRENVIFKCQFGHTTELAFHSFGNKRRLLKNNPEDLCSDCKKDKEHKIRFEEIKKQIFDCSGHVLLTLAKVGDECTYECFNCSEENKVVSFKNLTRLQSGNCRHCVNDKNKNSEEDVAKRLEPHGFILIEYNNRRDVRVRCKNNHEVTVSLGDITNRGRGCPECAPEKRKNTNIERYGVECVFESEIIKEKIVQTNLEKHGVRYPQQNAEIRDKTINTCVEKYGVRFAFCQSFVYEKIKKRHVEKYGREYPLQCEEIQAKIEKTCLEIYGVRRPFLSELVHEKIKETCQMKYGTDYFFGSEAMKKMMIEKYGSECVVNSDAMKKIMMEKYGSEYFINSDAMKKMMMEKYGSEYFINSEAMKKMMMEKYGSEYFINSEAMKKMMMEKYGSEYFINSDAMKKMMMEKYGSEYFINSDAMKKMMMEKYGAPCAMQVPQFFHQAIRTAFKTKDYVLPETKRVLKVQGYEPYFLDKIILEKHPDTDEKITEDDIMVGEDVLYFKYKDEDNKDRIYYPDMMLKNTKHIYEVKSVYTFNMNVNRNICKFKSLIGYILHVIIYSSKKRILDVWTIKDGIFHSEAGITDFSKCLPSKVSLKETQLELVSEDIISELLMDKPEDLAKF